MMALHAGQGAEADLGERFIMCFVQAADDAGLSDDPDFRNALRLYMEWAVRDVLSYSPRGTQVPSGLSVPHWGWNGLENSS
jgi:hemoglobin